MRGLTPGTGTGRAGPPPAGGSVSAAVLGPDASCGTETATVADKDMAKFLAGVRQLVAEAAETVAASVGSRLPSAIFCPGKMLRSRLVARVHTAMPGAVDPAVLIPCCAAVELIHTASLCHDDVVDNALVRRGGARARCRRGLPRRRA